MYYLNFKLEKGEEKKIVLFFRLSSGELKLRGVYQVWRNLMVNP